MNDRNKRALPLGSALVAGLVLSATAAADNPFGVHVLKQGYQLAMADTKARDGKCGEAKCGAGKKAAAQARAGNADTAKDAGGAADEPTAKAHDGSCGANKADAKAHDGSCGVNKETPRLVTVTAARTRQTPRLVTAVAARTRPRPRPRMAIAARVRDLDPGRGCGSRPASTGKTPCIDPCLREQASASAESCSTNSKRVCRQP